MDLDESHHAKTKGKVMVRQTFCWKRADAMKYYDDTGGKTGFIKKKTAVSCCVEESAGCVKEATYPSCDNESLPLTVVDRKLRNRTSKFDIEAGKL